jgi:hypothetical protein
LDDIIKIEARDDDFIGSKHIAEGSIKVEAFTKKGGYYDSVELHKKNKPEGIVVLRAEWKPVPTEQELKEKKVLQDRKDLEKAAIRSLTSIMGRPVAIKGHTGKYLNCKSHPIVEFDAGTVGP